MGIVSGVSSSEDELPRSCGFTGTYVNLKLSFYFKKYSLMEWWQ